MSISFGPPHPQFPFAVRLEYGYISIQVWRIGIGASDRDGSVNWAVTGSGNSPVSAADFEGGVLPSGTLRFAAGETYKELGFSIRSDGVFEQDEGFTVTLSNASDGQMIGIATTDGIIQNDDASFAIAATSAANAEGNSGSTACTFTVTRSGLINQDSIIYYVVTGSSGNPASADDFVQRVLPSGSVSFAWGETSKSITVLVAGDSAAEQNEEFTVTLRDLS